jgi:outer membrane receptor protein involved in Fe transport
VDVRGGSLSSALGEFARESWTELLFDQELVAGFTAPPVRGRLTRPEALSRLLAGTGVGFREAGGSIILFRVPAEPDTYVSGEAAIPEILVIGRRSQNVDIRRTGNDIQPYKISSRQEIKRAHRSNVEEFTRARVPANAQTRALAQDVVRGQPGNVRSGIDLRGLGRRRTLVLVDGRRLPRAIDFSIDFDQADLNGVPVSAIDRIETLTGTAGGIYGPGALGGVVNVVLRRDYEGAELHVTSGISSRGDARRLQVEGRVGFSPNEGRTGIMLLASHQMNQPLLAGERDFSVRARRRQFANDPADFLKRLRAGNSVSVFSASGADLVLDPDFGGASLGASYTYLPLGFSGTRADGVALLKKNAGEIDLDLPADRSGVYRSLVSRATVTSGLVNLRHALSDEIELFVDGLAYRNRGSFRSGSSEFISPTLPNASTNPFAQAVYFRYPLPGSRQDSRVTSDTARLSAGVIAGLGAGWSASADYGIGFSRADTQIGGATVVGGYSNAVMRGTPGAGGLPAIDPLGNWEELLAATALYEVQLGTSLTSRNRLEEANARLAGPLLRSRAGPVVLSLLAQHRVEKVPESVFRVTIADSSFSVFSPFRKQAVSSGYAEVRVPLVAQDVGLFRGLELQFAARYDRSSTAFREKVTLFEPASGAATRVERHGFNYTAGARFYPLPHLMFRGSIATGELYPTVGQLTPIRDTSRFGRGSSGGGADPKRGGQTAGGGGPVEILSGGSPSIKPERATTISLGAILNPSGGKWPRVSIDYSRIDRRGEVSPFPLSLAALIVSEEEFPERVSRGPLTEADARLGFTAGPVTRVDLAPLNAGRTIADAIDVEFGWRMPFIAGSRIDLYGSATLQPRLKTRSRDGQPWVERIGYFDGALARRGNVGAEWRLGPLSVDLNLQFFDGYRVTYADPTNTVGRENAQVLRYQGREHVPSQVYVDLSVRRRLQLTARSAPLNALDLRFGIQNLFDRRPPLIANPAEVPYSTYGDARRRRFELALSSEF